jgi:hypothetical protein
MNAQQLQQLISNSVHSAMKEAGVIINSNTGADSSAPSSKNTEQLINTALENRERYWKRKELKLNNQ